MSRPTPIRADSERAIAPTRRSRLPPLLLAVFGLIWLLLAWQPSYRQDWLLENVLVLVAVPALVWAYPRRRLSDGSYLALFVFLLLHEVGAHYTYSEVPYEQWLRDLTGWSPAQSLGFIRNHYDRLLHLLFGLLVTPAIADLLQQVVAPRGIWRLLLPVSMVMAQSALYELLEWAAALVFGGELGVAYLGTQGDSWDAQRDMALALLGSVSSALLLLLRRGIAARLRFTATPAAARPVDPLSRDAKTGSI